MSACSIFYCLLIIIACLASNNYFIKYFLYLYLQQISPGIVETPFAASFVGEETAAAVFNSMKVTNR